MSAAAAVVAIIVAVGEARSPASTALVAAAEESLGTAASVRLIELRSPTDASAIHIERDATVSTTVVVLWKDPAHLHAVFRLHVARTNRWTTRSLRFAAGDTLGERGRTLGLAVASMVPETTKARQNPLPMQPPPLPSRAPPAPAPPQPQASSRTPPVPASPANPPLAPSAPTVEPSSSAAPPTPSARTPVPLAPESPPESAKPIPETPPPPAAVAIAPSERSPPVRPAPESPRLLAIGLGVQAATGLGGVATGFGGQIDAARFSTDRLAVRAGLAVRSGSVPTLPGLDIVSSVAVGFEWWPLGQPTRATWGLGVRSDAMLWDHRVTATPTGSPNETQHSFKPGVDVMGQFLAGLTPSLSVVGFAGLEGALGTTQLQKGNDRALAATIPALRLVAGCEVRIGF